MDEWLLRSMADNESTTPLNGSMCSVVIFSREMAPFSARSRPMLPDPLHHCRSAFVPFECAVRLCNKGAQFRLLSTVTTTGLMGVHTGASPNGGSQFFLEDTWPRVQVIPCTVLYRLDRRTPPGVTLGKCYNSGTWSWVKPLTIPESPPMDLYNTCPVQGLSSLCAKCTAT